MVSSEPEPGQSSVRPLDAVPAPQAPLDVERGGPLRAGSAKAPSKVARLTPHPGTIVGDPEDLVHIDWSGEWSP